MGVEYFLAKFCKVPVMKAWVKKNPLIQYTLGAIPLFIHELKKDSLSSRSFTHEPSGFRDGYATAAHSPGTFPITMELPICSSSADISTSPLIAFCTSLSEEVTCATKRLNRINSCVSTVFMDSS